MTEIVISGVGYHAACDPNASDVPRQEGWPEPRVIKRGRGHQYVYPFSPSLAEQIASHMEDLAASFLYGSPEDRAEARALQRDAGRIRKLLAH